jgi:hypothetical protein
MHIGPIDIDPADTLPPIPLFSNGDLTLHKPILAGIPKESKNWNKKLRFA